MQFLFPQFCSKIFQCPTISNLTFFFFFFFFFIRNNIRARNTKLYRININIFLYIYYIHFNKISSKFDFIFAIIRLLCMRASTIRSSCITLHIARSISEGKKYRSHYAWLIITYIVFPFFWSKLYPLHHNFRVTSY